MESMGKINDTLRYVSPEARKGVLKSMAVDAIKERHEKVNCDEFLPASRVAQDRTQRVVCESCRVVLFKFGEPDE